MRLVGQRRPHLAHPVLGDRRHQPAPGRGMRVGGAVEAARQPERQGGRRLHVERQVGQHLRHQRLVDEMLLEHGAVPAVVDGVGERQPHQAGRAHRAVEPRARHHLDDGRHAAALLADQPGVRSLELHLGGGIGAVAELVLEPLEAQRIDGAVGQEARHQEAGEAARRLRQHQEGVAHGRRHEPLVPGDAGTRRRARRCRSALPWWCWRARRCRPASPSCPCRW